MQSPGANQNTCRICLEQTAILDWNDEIVEFCGTTYKSCYYKYTQLKEIVTDPLPQMLCDPCSKDLKRSYVLIKKALESQIILQHKYGIIITEDEKDPVEQHIIVTHFQLNDLKLEKDPNEQTVNPAEFETVFFNQTPKRFKIDDEEMLRISVDETETNTKDLKKENGNNKKQKEAGNIKVESDIDDFQKYKSQETIFESSENSNSLSSQKEITTRQKMCQYCSKIIDSGYLKRHEATHHAHRERIEICPICGIKLYNKWTMKIHMKNIHQNREKEFKCDFCDKTYFQRGTLNVHRRIHLGQMIACPICSKEYSRQCDVDKHMKIHSATPIHNVKKSSKYYVECKECGKSVRSQCFKEHQAFHLNKPVVKCNICNKDFFSLSKCSRHMRQVHKKTRNECTTYYEENHNQRRLTHLRLNQQEKLQEMAK